MSKLINGTAISDSELKRFSAENSVKINDELFGFLLLNNGSQVVSQQIDVDGKNYGIANILDFNEDAPLSAWKTTKHFANNGYAGYAPIARDAFDNYFVVHNNDLLLFDGETDEMKIICKDATSAITSLTKNDN